MPRQTAFLKPLSGIMTGVRKRKHRLLLIADSILLVTPKASKSKVARETKYGLSTIRKYWDYIATDKPFVDFDKKHQKTN